MKIKFKHVSAHSGDAYNDEADKLAKEGARKYQPDDWDWIKQNHFLIQKFLSMKINSSQKTQPNYNQNKSFGFKMLFVIDERID